jgi:hypothetical protein
MASAPKTRIRLTTLTALALVALLISACTQPTPPTPTFDLTVVLAGDGSGSVTSSPEGIDTAANEFVGTFDEGTEVTLTAVADDGSAFVDFTGATCGAGSTATTCVVTVEADATITATFEAEQFVVASSGIELESFRFASGMYASIDTATLPGVGLDPDHAIFGLTMHPTNPWLFVSSFVHSTWGDARIDVFEFVDGVFSHVVTNEMADFDGLGCWDALDGDYCATTEMTFNAAGTQLWVNEDNSDVAITFTVDATTGVLTYVDDTPRVSYQGLVKHPTAPYLYNGLNTLAITGGVAQDDPNYLYEEGGNGPMVFETAAGWRLLSAIDNQDVVLADLADPAAPAVLDTVALTDYYDARFASADLDGERVIVVGDDLATVLSFAGDTLTDLGGTDLEQLVLGTTRVFRGVAWVPGTNTAVAAWFSSDGSGGYSVLEVAGDGSVTIAEELAGAGRARAVIVVR